jgi:hypothetical protein
MLNAISTVLFIKVNDGLGVTIRGVTMTAGLQLLPQSRVVVDFTIEDDPDGAILIADGLMSSGQIDDAETAHAEPNATLGVNPIVIGTAMHHRVAHPSKKFGLQLCARRKLHNATDSAHLLLSLSSGLDLTPV